jgi:hypothetical protein
LSNPNLAEDDFEFYSLNGAHLTAPTQFIGVNGLPNVRGHTTEQ